MINKKIVCVGDSLTAGYGIDSGQRWTNFLSKDLNIEVINSGVSGDTTSGMLARFYQTAIIHKPSYIIITGGTNDLWFNLSDNLIIANILAMTRQAKYYNITPIIGIPTPFYNFESLSDDSPFIKNESFSKRIHSFQKLLKDFALNDEQKIIDFSLNMKSDLFLEDGLHPNEEGHLQMFNNARLSMENYLNL